MKKMEEKKNFEYGFVHVSAKMKIREVKSSLVISMSFRVDINSRNALELVRKEKDLN